MNSSRRTYWRFAGLLSVLILPAAARADDGRHPGSVDVFHCKFDHASDTNYDRWPDRWIRKSGADYPHYVNMEIHDDASAAGGKALVIELDGAAASIASPPIRVTSRFGYVFEAQLKNENLAHSTVLLTLSFCDTSGRVLETRESDPVGNTSGWRRIRLDKIEPSGPEIDRVIVGLEVVRGTKGDLKGKVALADVRLGRLPRIKVSTNSACNVYPTLDDVVVRCELSGIRQRRPQVHFQLFDAAGNADDEASFQFDGKPITENAEVDAEFLDSARTGLAGYEGSVEWRPKVRKYGFYRVVVRVDESSSKTHATSAGDLASRTVRLAVAPPLDMPTQGEFGWTLPHGDGSLSYHDMGCLLAQVGVNWVKVPARFDADDSQRCDELIRFVEQLSASHIDVVGIIDRPSVGSELAQRFGRDAPIADVLAPDASVWSPALEPVMTRLAMRVRSWQIGRDGDTSLADLPDLNKWIDDLRTHLFRFGQDVRLGINRSWANAEDRRGRVAWDFEQMCSDTRLSEHEFYALVAGPRRNPAERWVTIEPPAPTNEPATADALDARSSEFVRQLVAAKVHGADAIIISEPFNEDYGLMHPDGGPAELLLPWRTTAAMLGGAQYVGKLELPAGSDNRVFLRPDGQVVMVAWNNEPMIETLYLGSHVRHIDLWGRTTMLDSDGAEQSIHVGPRPTFVLGLHEPITRWRMALSIQRKLVPSIFGKPHANSLHLENPFQQGVGGSLRIVVPRPNSDHEDLADHDRNAEPTGLAPDRWLIEPPTMRFRLAPGEQVDFPFTIRLRNAFYGRQPVRIEFNVEADEPYKFSVYREMEVGTDDLTLDVTSHLDSRGALIVEQQMTNSAPQLADFRCYLWAKGRRYQRSQVYRLGKNLNRKVYRYPDGRSLIGQELLLEIEELNGPRVLKYRFVATETSATDTTDSTDASDADPVRAGTHKRDDDPGGEQGEHATATPPLRR